MTNADLARAEDAKHVLVVEDEPQMRSMLADNLEFEGYRVTAVTSGEEALQAVAGAALRAAAHRRDAARDQRLRRVSAAARPSPAHADRGADGARRTSRTASAASTSAPTTT